MYLSFIVDIIGSTFSGLNRTLETFIIIIIIIGSTFRFQEEAEVAIGILGLFIYLFIYLLRIVRRCHQFCSVEGRLLLESCDRDGFLQVLLQIITSRIGHSAAETKVMMLYK